MNIISVFCFGASPLDGPVIYFPSSGPTQTPICVCVCVCARILLFFVLFLSTKRWRDYQTRSRIKDLVRLFSLDATFFVENFRRLFLACHPSPPSSLTEPSNPSTNQTICCVSSSKVVRFLSLSLHRVPVVPCFVRNNNNHNNSINTMAPRHGRHSIRSDCHAVRPGLVPCVCLFVSFALHLLVLFQFPAAAVTTRHSLSTLRTFNIPFRISSRR